MQHVLVHIDPHLGPIGAWSYQNRHLLHFYPDSLDPTIPARAREAMAQRDLHTPIPDWFAHLAAHSSTLDQYETLDLDHPLNLPLILVEFRRAWNASSEPA